MIFNPSSFSFQFVSVFYRMETGEAPLVNTAAYLAKSIIYNNKERLMASLMVAGWDKHKGGQVYVVPIGGMVSRRKIHISGSGCVFPMGYLDANYRPDMSQEECLQLAVNAVAMAIARDGSSGGCIRYAVINKDGVFRNHIVNNQIPRYFEN